MPNINFQIKILIKKLKFYLQMILVYNIILEYNFSEKN